MRFLLYSLAIMGSSLSFSQTTTTIQENSETGVITEKNTIGNTSVVNVKKESKLTISTPIRPKKVRKEEIIVETKKKKE